MWSFSLLAVSYYTQSKREYFGEVLCSVARQLRGHGLISCWYYFVLYLLAASFFSPTANKQKDVKIPVPLAGYKIHAFNAARPKVSEPAHQPTFLRAAVARESIWKRQFPLPLPQWQPVRMTRIVPRVIVGEFPLVLVERLFAVTQELMRRVFSWRISWHFPSFLIVFSPLKLLHVWAGFQFTAGYIPPSFSPASQTRKGQSHAFTWNDLV